MLYPISVTFLWGFVNSYAVVRRQSASFRFVASAADTLLKFSVQISDFGTIGKNQSQKWAK